MPGSERKGSFKGRVLAIAAAVVAAIFALVVGFLFTNSFGISQVASHARELHWTNATIGSAGIARASVAQAVFFSFDERLGVSSPEARDAAIDEALANLTDVRALLESPEALPGEPTRDAIALLIDSGQRTLELASGGQPDEAEAIRISEFEPAFEELSNGLDRQQTTLAASIAESEQVQGRISRLTQLAVTLLIPGVAMVAFWLILRRRVQQTEIEMEAKLEAERELSMAKDEFIAGLSHELRTPLTTIVGFSELLLEGDLDPDESDEMLTIINAGSSDLSRMVEDLLVAARIDAGALSYTPKRIDLADEARQVVAPYVRAGDSIQLQVPRMEVYADSLLVRQILHNLVSNARKHGGENILITGMVQSTRAMLVVADDGPGLPEHVEANLFQRFVNRGKVAVTAGSVGLGLAISKELAMGLGGSIHYKRVDGWTTFTVRLRALPTGERRSEHPAPMSLSATHR